MNKIAIIVFGLFVAARVIGHTGGFTYEVAIGDYFVDIGASKLVLVPNELTLFEYNIYTKSDPNNLAGFDRVYVTVSDEKSVLFSTFVHRPEGMLTTLSYVFPKSGKYEMSARFEGGQGTMAEVSFPVEVEASGLNPDVVKSGIIFLGFGVALGYGMAYLRKNILTDK